MKKLLICAFATLLMTPGFSFSQQQSDPLQFMQGLRQNENQFFQLGYHIFSIVTVNKKYSEKEINKVLKKYDIKKPLKRYPDRSIASENTVVEYETQNKEFPEVTEMQKAYFFPVGEKKMRHIIIQTIVPDSLLEKSFLEAYFNDSLDKYIVYDLQSTRTLNFLGREIKLGAPCSWMFVNNLQCPANGQMSWSVHPTLEEAQQRTQLQMAQNAKRKILKSEKFNIIFEGEPTTAIRIVYKFNIPRIIMRGSNNLAVFYVTANVRGQNVSCILSNYVENENDYTIGALLNEVMKLAE